MIKKPEDEEQELFIRISNPLVLRKTLLETSKLVLTVLKQTYRIKQIREAKHIVMDLLSKEEKELKILVQKLEEYMPKYNKNELKKYLPDVTKLKKPEPEPVRAEAKPQLRPEEKEQPRQPRPLSDAERLAKALEDVQRKLQSL